MFNYNISFSYHRFIFFIMIVNISVGVNKNIGYVRQANTQSYEE